MVCRIYNHTEALSLIIKAHKQVVDTPTYRMGQALYNLLPNDVAEASKKLPYHANWYESNDRTLCIKYFYDHFVK